MSGLPADAGASSQSARAEVLGVLTASSVYGLLKGRERPRLACKWIKTRRLMLD